MMAVLMNMFAKKIFLSSANSALATVESLKHNGPLFMAVRCYKLRQNKPPPSGKFWRTVHYPEEYTVKPLNVTRLGGRDPETGRKIVIGIGGGIKYKYHWIEFKRVGPKEKDVPPLEEKVIMLKDVMERTAKIALVASGDRMKWIIAHENMKPGDIIRTSMYIPHNPIAPNEGDAYPLGALPIGTVIHSIEKYTGQGGYFCQAAGASAKITRAIEDRVVVILPSKLEIALPKENMAVVGRVSNILHSKTPIGSPQRLRELGHRPRSGLWHRKDGRFGRKIKAPKPLKIIDLAPKEEPEILQLTYNWKQIPHLKIT